MTDKMKKILIAVVIVAFSLLLLLFSPLKNLFHSGPREEFGYLVSFLSDDGTVLKVDKVRPNEAAVPPQVPEMSFGKVFLRWDGDFSCVTQDMEVRPITEDIAANMNVLMIGGSSCKKGESLTIPLKLDGEVKLCGFEMEISYDPEILQFTEFSCMDGGVIANCDAKKGKIALNYLSTDNTAAAVDLCDMVFHTLKGAADVPIQMTVTECIALDDENKVYNPEYNIVQGSISVYEETQNITKEEETK